KKVKLFVNPLTSHKVMIGLRLFLAGLILFLGLKSGYAMSSMVLAAIVMKFPSFKFNPRLLLDGPTPEEAQKKLLETIEAKVAEVVAKSQKENISKATLDAEVEKLNKMVAKLSEEG